ncbi:MAG TPA: M14 family zinc carboxypeptidase, partial [Thermomicrobiales bacterium]|nr:M14 family zinc carboxypeptidase [Thermomicrobiales bacterium]
MSVTRESLSNLAAYFQALPGEDRVLIPWKAMREWFRDVARVSDRLSVEDIGEATLGAPTDLLIISSPSTIRDLPAILARRGALADRDLLADPAHNDGHQAGDKPVVLITAGIHADEVGGVQLMPELVRDLAFSDDPAIASLLDRVIILIVPTLNPDGMNLVHEWYTKTLGSPAEGLAPPALYHPYAGHDNNRDWYTHALRETRHTIDSVHRPWRPHIVLDLHQMGWYSPRYVVPPYIDPLEPHVHPRISALSNEIGSAIGAAQVRDAHAGVASGVMFDCYSPTRAFQHYHGGVRILAEAASAKIASPIDVDRGQVEVRRGFDPNVASTHMSIVWNGGTWRLRDIMDYHRTTIRAVLDHAAIHAGQWIRDQWTMLADEVTQQRPPAYVIAPLRQQIDPAAAVELIETLRRGDVEIHFVESGDARVQANSFLVRANQPFGSYARALLDLTPYPQPRISKDATSPAIPYDVTSHCLPIHMGVEVARIDEAEGIATRQVIDRDLSAFSPPSAADIRRDRWLAIDARSHAAIRVVTNALQNGAEVRRLLRPHFDAGRLLDAGTWLVTDDHAFASMSDAHRRHVRTWLVNPIPTGTAIQTMPRIGLHLPHSDNAIDAGWARLWLEQSDLPYDIIRDNDIREGNLVEIDGLLVPHRKPKQLLNRDEGDRYPEEFRTGLGEEGTLALGQFMENGGHIVALDGAAKALIPAWHLPVQRPLEGLKETEFSCPGSVLRIMPNPAHPVTLGMQDPIPVMFVDSTAFRVEWDEAGQVAARYAREGLLVSGWIQGEEHVQGLAAIVDLAVGKGHLTGFGFRPHFRCQMCA